jgi:hypothetical protein
MRFSRLSARSNALAVVASAIIISNRVPLTMGTACGNKDSTFAASIFSRCLNEEEVRSRALASSPSATPKVAMNESMSVVRTRVGAHFLSLDVATSRTKDRIAGSSVPACATADSISGHHNFSSTDLGSGESDGLLVGCSGRAFLRAVLTCAYVAVTKQRRKGT